MLSLFQYAVRRELGLCITVAKGYALTARLLTTGDRLQRDRNTARQDETPVNLENDKVNAREIRASYKAVLTE